MKIGAMNNPDKDLYKEIRFIGENGFDFVDLTIEPENAYSETVDAMKVKSLLKKYRLEAVGHTPWNFPVASSVKDIRKAAYREFDKCLKVFDDIGISLVNIHPGRPTESMSSDQLLMYNLEFYDYITKHAKKYNIQIMLENAPPINSIDAFNAIFDNIPKLKLHLDIGHLNLGGDGELKTELFFHTFHERIAHVHFSDNKGDEDEHLPLGVGNINWELIIKIMKKYKYDGTITLEIHAPDRDYLMHNKKKLAQL